MQLLGLNNTFNLFGLEIHYYGLLIGLGFLVGFLVLTYLFKKKGFDKEMPYTLLLMVFPAAIIGARLYYVIFSGRSWTFLEIFEIWNGGLAIYGGIIASAIVIGVYCYNKKVNVLTLFDVIVPCLIIGQTFGRWGNFLNQEAYGQLITNEALQFFPFAVFIESENAFFQATFFYESFWNTLAFIPLFFVARSNAKTGTATSMYLILYGLVRAIIEGFRSDSLWGGGFRVSQVLSILLVFLGIAMFILSTLGKLEPKKFTYPIEKKSAKK